MRWIRPDRLPRPEPTTGRVRIAQAGGLVALVWAVSSQHEDGAPHVPTALLTLATVGWVAWLLCGRLGAPPVATVAALAVVGGAGASVAGLAPVGLAFPAVAVIATAALAGVRTAVAIALIAAASLVVTVLAERTPHAIITEGLLTLVAALLGGASRRQYAVRAEQAEQLLAEQRRADTERSRTVVLEERNRIGREVHDVLAHSLGALSVQLEAADALLEAAPDTAAARRHVQQARRLALEGLAETRRAVHVLRDTPPALSEQLRALAEADGAELQLTGTERSVSADVQLALYRAAQEALTNARKHAPGAAVTLVLEFGPADAVLSVTNGPSPGPDRADALSTSGGGFGLRGMRERIELLGGHVSAAPQDAGWNVRVAVPT